MVRVVVAFFYCCLNPIRHYGKQENRVHEDVLTIARKFIDAMHLFQPPWGLIENLSANNQWNKMLRFYWWKNTWLDRSQFKAVVSLSDVLEC